MNQQIVSGGTLNDFCTNSVVFNVGQPGRTSIPKISRKQLVSHPSHSNLKLTIIRSPSHQQQKKDAKQKDGHTQNKTNFHPGTLDVGSIHMEEALSRAMKNGDWRKKRRDIEAEYTGLWRTWKDFRFLLIIHEACRELVGIVVLGSLLSVWRVKNQDTQIIAIRVLF